ncbi:MULTISPECIES: hypothetical protein [unclassified Streptomyces]|uniref:hypothetical protein n=1 Tax=unclassified Streptomyces TaxID=2593676 RepID=UPI001F520D0C|nr:hypothetical protein [Streptomyces sp. CB02058]
MLVALVGVVGTLLAPLTTNWVSARVRLQEFDLQQRASALTREEEAATADLERRRAAYIALNSSARLWRLLLMEDVHALRAGGSTGEQTEQARQAFQADFAQAQMLIPDHVLDAANRVRIALADARKRLDRHTEGDGASEAAWQDLYDFVLGVWGEITEMQAAMRKDLGVGSGVPVPSERSETYQAGS